MTIGNAPNELFTHVVVNNRTAKWYRLKGYDVPTQDVQLYATYRGRRIKNGIYRGVLRGTTISVAVKDLLPESPNETVIPFVCGRCGGLFTTSWRCFKVRQGVNCRQCTKRGPRGTGSHAYWVEELLRSEDARCDISGETDIRFLELHHLLSRKLGGTNERSNYVILSSNYHQAFHSWMGGPQVPCRPEDYAEFKKLEKLGHRPSSNSRGYIRRPRE